MLAQKNQRLVIQGAAKNVHGGSGGAGVGSVVSSGSTSSSSSSSSSQSQSHSNSRAKSKPARASSQSSSSSKQSKPQINSSFDDLVEAGHHPPDSTPSNNVAIVSPQSQARRAGFQPHIPGRYPGPPGATRIGGFYCPPPEEEEDDNDNDNSDQGSDSSEPELAKKVSMHPSPRPKPKGKRGVQIQVRTSSNSEEDDDDDLTQLKPLSQRRKGSVAPMRIIIPNSNFNHSNPNSNGHANKEDVEKGGSPTPSTTSISSLLKEKLGQLPIPSMFRNKKPREYKLQAFVAILFLTILVLVGSIYIIHKEKELQKSYFDRIRFSSKDRRIRVTNIQDRIVLSGHLGVNLNSKDKPWPCLVEHQRENETCLEWMGKARLYLKTKAPPPKGLLPTGTFSNPSDIMGNNILCYGIYWEALSDGFPVKDCYDMGENRIFYGGGETENDQWPLNKTVIPYSPFLTGNKMGGKWGRSLRRYFVNSEGAAIKVTDLSPLYVSINHPRKREICFGAENDGFGYPRGNLPFLNYTICTAENALEISKRLADKDIWERVRHEDAQLSYFIAEHPIWRIRPEVLDVGNQSDVALLNHTDKIAEIQSEGFILLDETWQHEIGDLESDTTRFSNLAETFNITKRRGFKLALTVQPFFSTQSKLYVQGLENEVWLMEKPRDTPYGHGYGYGAGATHNHPSHKGVPALTEFKQWNSVAVLDVTNQRARDWFHDKIQTMSEKYGIEALYADMGTTFDLPQYYEFAQPLPSADHTKDEFLQILRYIPYISTIGVTTAVKLPKPPTYVALSPTESSWEGLQTVIPNMLTMGLAGFPFLIPGSIGGDYFPEKVEVKDKMPIPEQLTMVDNVTSSSSSSSTSTSAPTSSSSSSLEIQDVSRAPITTASHLPDRELYIRWLQLAHFLPVVQYSFLPNDYDEEVIRIAKDLGKERSQKLWSYLKKAMDEALTTGMPIIRPLWMIDPLDQNCLRVSDEFAIGEDIIVAPVLKPNSTERDIYLPRGIWKDELERSSTKGERWLHNYKVKHNQIPYFIKLPDTGQILSSR